MRLQPSHFFLLPFFAAVALPFLRWIKPELERMASMLTFACLAYLSMGVMLQTQDTGPLIETLGNWPAPWGITLHIDGLAAFLVALMAVIGFFRTLYLHAAEQRPGSESLVMLLTLGLIGQVCTRDFFNLYVFLEISALSAYALLAQGGPRACLGVFRYLLVGGIGAAFYLLGLGFLYAKTGVLNMDMMGAALLTQASPAVWVGLLLMVTGVFLKCALFPLHGWLPDIYTYGPVESVGFIAPLMTKVSSLVVFRIFFDVFHGHPLLWALKPLVMVLALTAIIYGSLMAFRQSDIRRLLAFSSISQLGIILLALSVGTQAALLGSFLHLGHHAFIKCLLFLSAGVVIRETGSPKLKDHKGLAQRSRFWALPFAFGALALMGIPPLSGFFSKWQILTGMLPETSWLTMGIFLLGSLLTTAYGFKIIECHYLTLPKSEQMPLFGPRPREIFAVSCLMVASLVLGLGGGNLLAPMVKRKGLTPMTQISSTLSPDRMLK